MILDNNYTVKKTKEELLLEQLVNIESQTSNMSGNKKVLKVIERKLSDLNFHVKYHKSTCNDNRSILVAKRKAARNNALSVCFIGHSDVVTKPKDNHFEMTSERIIGSGVADNKGGVVLMLSALNILLSKVNMINIDVTVVISPSEETGSIGFHEYFQNIGKMSDYVIGLEPALSCGSIIGSRSGNRWYNIKSNGIAAHSGRFGQDYINAAHQLSLLISRLHTLNSEEMKRRVNVGGFQTTLNSYNTICSSAMAKVDTRFASAECRSVIHDFFISSIEESTLVCPYSSKSGNIIYSIEDDCPPMQKTSNIWLKPFLTKVNQLENTEVQETHSGGAADINYFAHSDAVLIDGFGPIGGGLHTKNEYIDRQSLVTRKFALVDLLMSLNENNNRRVSWN